MEDCIDVVNLLYQQYDVLFLFDHSCGHDRQHKDGLNVENMSKSYGGKQSILRTSLIKQERGYLGRFPRTLNPGDMRQMVFVPGDEGPFWMTTEQRQSTRLDIEIQGKVIKRNFTKEELTKKLACIKEYLWKQQGVQHQPQKNLQHQSKLKKIVKEYKTHRCALDFDKGFIKANIIVID
jgi:hypothetical protein